MQNLIKKKEYIKKKKKTTHQGSLDESYFFENITKWGYRQATDKRRLPVSSIFHARNHGTILFFKLRNLIIQITQKTHFLKNQKKVPQKKLGGPGGKAPPLAEKVV